ncbi:bacillithiol biosynthesis deacetylase BshB1 [Salipaludibacillus sp. CF4.18]|uniref:bacillithiol biosynthesis deacetylase BshB1 n=1 Tax=Salipaludibacillus sp. CF4.18 TaxID=3373081 RepID=UPI003EE459B6
MEEKIDFLAIGAHPDDIEIGMGGTIAKFVKAGKRGKVVHLTYAELSSNGTVEKRQEEARAACEILGVGEHIQLPFADRGLLEARREIIEALVKIIRTYKPKFVFASATNDRHPDHGHCGVLVKEAVFSAGIKNYLSEFSFRAHRPKALYYYQINGLINPDFLIDTTAFIDTKFKALSCFESQFKATENDTVTTPLNSGYLERLKSRDHLLGAEVGVEYAEGFISEKPILIHDLLGDSL